jgi:hypothetical protein
MAAVFSSVSRFWTLIVLGKEGGSLVAVGEGGKVRNGGVADGRCRVVNLGLKRIDAGVQILSKIVNASFDPCDEAVVKRM